MSMHYKSLFLVLLLLITNSHAEFLRRQKRTYSRLSAIGYLFAITIPIDLPSRNVFFSFNYEFNYGLPTSPSDYLPSWINETLTNFGIHKRSLINRKSIYEMIIEKLEGVNSGEDCLMRLICETQESSINEVNGVLGDLVHIILTPSTSASEGLQSRYYEAEMHGRNGDGCRQYNSMCPECFLDYFTESEPFNSNM